MDTHSENRLRLLALQGCFEGGQITANMDASLSIQERTRRAHVIMQKMIEEWFESLQIMVGRHWENRHGIVMNPDCLIAQAEVETPKSRLPIIIAALVPEEVRTLEGFLLPLPSESEVFGQTREQLFRYWQTFCRNFVNMIQALMPRKGIRSVVIERTAASEYRIELRGGRLLLVIEEFGD